MNAEIVAIGTELLLGQIVDTNAVYIAEHLNRQGIGVLYKSTVGDNPQRMKAVLTQALTRADVVITSGGLGPTEDDLTREIAAEVTGRKLVLNQEALDQVKRIFHERQIPFKDNNKGQAYIPEGAIIIENPQGTAPGYIIESDQGILISLPGVPREMKYLMQETVLPYLKQKLGKSQVIKYRVLKLCGTGESNVDYAIRDLIQTNSNPTIGLLAHLGQIDIRITAKADTEAEADQRIAALEAKIRERLPHQIFGVDDDTQEEVIARLLGEHHQSVAVAETNTGGHLGRGLIAVPGIDTVYRGGVIATDVDSLHRLLPLPDGIVEREGLLSLDTAQAMAAAIKERCQASIGLGITGYRQSLNGKIADAAVPSFIAIQKADGTWLTREYRVSGPPEIIQTRVTHIALELLRRVILGLESSFGD